jgi:hypothetical protein
VWLNGGQYKLVRAKGIPLETKAVKGELAWEDVGAYGTWYASTAPGLGRKRSLSFTSAPRSMIHKSAGSERAPSRFLKKSRKRVPLFCLSALHPTPLLVVGFARRWRRYPARVTRRLGYLLRYAPPNCSEHNSGHQQADQQATNGREPIMVVGIEQQQHYPIRGRRPRSTQGTHTTTRTPEDLSLFMPMDDTRRQPSWRLWNRDSTASAIKAASSRCGAGP